MSARRWASAVAVMSFSLLCAFALVCAPAWAAAPPVVESESFSDAGSASAAVNAQVNAEGIPTTYFFEYGTSAAYGSSTPTAQLGSAAEAIGVIAELGELEPETTYHFRVVASNAAGTAQGADQTLTTFPVQLLGLPDERGYEMVTPAENEDADVYVPLGSNAALEEATITALPARAAADGSAVAYVGDPTSGGNGSSGNGGGNEYMARRGSAGDWTQSILQPAGRRSPIYVSLSSDLSVGVLESSEPLSAGVGEGVSDLYAAPTQGGGYRPFFTGTPNEEVYAITPGGSRVRIGDYFAGASSDFSHLLFEATAALTPNAISGSAEDENNLYESVNGQLELVNVLPDGSTQPGAFFGSASEEGLSTTHAISADGSLVFWSDTNTNALYVRESGTSTAQIDRSQGSGPSGGGMFWTASSDGTKAFFTDCSRLTPNSTAVSSKGCGSYSRSGGLTGNDLYEYEVPTGRLTDLSEDENPSDPLGADVQGVIGASEDGEYVYFVADGVLADGATAGQPNLYLRHGGATTLVATLSAEDDRVGGSEFYGNDTAGDWQPSPGQKTAEVTPDGHSLVFTSARSLTGYENLNPVGNAMAEVYVYNAVSGTLACASCDPSGDPPLLATGLVAAFLPIGDELNIAYQLRVISENGERVLFESRESLAPQDTNGKMDVYEWEADGEGSCRREAGCLYLLSSGTSPAGTFLIDASASGDDVFMTTRAQLAEQDGNESYDVYDARVGVTQPPVAPQCSGTGCQGVPSAPPIFATPASATFTGIGNFAPPSTVTEVTPKLKKKPKQRHVKRKRKARRRTRHSAKARKSARRASERSGR